MLFLCSTLAAYSFMQEPPMLELVQQAVDVCSELEPPTPPLSVTILSGACSGITSAGSSPHHFTPSYAHSWAVEPTCRGSCLRLTISSRSALRLARI